MAVRELAPAVYAVGAVDWDRRLFDALIPLPEGTSYNAYLIKGGEKTALIDTVDPTKEGELLANLRQLQVEKLDYIIANHAEQDHSGTIPTVLGLYPDAKVVTNQKCREMLVNHLLIPEDRFQVINDGEALSLGAKTLEFIFAPWVHWPETMFTYLKEDKILFSCDFLGSHYATSVLYADPGRMLEPAKRYFAEIMMPFRTSIKKHLEKIDGMDVETVAPSHGPVYRPPDWIVNAYRDWTSDEVKNLVLIPYVSMHGSTEEMVRYLTKSLTERGIPVQPFNLTVTDLGALAVSLVDAATIVIGAPAVLVGPHPVAVHAAYLVNALRPKLRFASVIGSYGWAGKTEEVIKGLLTNLKVEMLSRVLVKGFPKEADYQALDRLADEILEKHRAALLTG